MVEKLERELLCYIVRFGDHPVEVVNPETGGKDTIPVVEYIKDDLEVDDLSFQNPLYQGMMMDYYERYKQDKISSSQFFIRNTNPDYVSVAADAMSDPYPLSKIFNENETNCRIKVKKVSVDAAVTLFHDLNYSLLNYKSHWLSNLIVEKTEKLRNNQEEAGTLIAQIQELMLFKKEIDKRLGERHIHP